MAQRKFESPAPGYESSQTPLNRAALEREFGAIEIANVKHRVSTQQELTPRQAAMAYSLGYEDDTQSEGLN